MKLAEMNGTPHASPDLTFNTVDEYLNWFKTKCTDGINCIHFSSGSMDEMDRVNSDGDFFDMVVQCGKNGGWNIKAYGTFDDTGEWFHVCLKEPKHDLSSNVKDAITDAVMANIDGNGYPE